MSSRATASCDEENTVTQDEVSPVLVLSMEIYSSS